VERNIQIIQICFKQNKEIITMKKIYQTPQMSEVRISVKFQLLEASPVLQAEGYNAESEVLSRRTDVDLWDFEDDDE
jgi:hypothetical protein